MSDTTTGLSFTPHSFALCLRPDADTPAVVAWGITLADGAAGTVDWQHGPSCVVALCGTADRAARLHDADLVGADQPADPPLALGQPP